MQTSIKPKIMVYCEFYRDFAGFGDQAVASGLDVVFFNNRGQAMEAVVKTAFAAIILEHFPPKFDVAAFLKLMRTSDMTTPVLACSIDVEPAVAIELLDLGADDFVRLPVDAGELHARLRAVRRRLEVAPPVAVIRAGSIAVNPLTREAWISGKPLDLQPLDFGCLLELAKHQDRVVSRQMLKENVWGDDRSIELQTIDVRIHSLRRIIDEPGKPSRIKTFRSAGYRLIVDE